MFKPLESPFKSSAVTDNETPFVNNDGHLDFSENDIESER